MIIYYLHLTYSAIFHVSFCHWKEIEHEYPPLCGVIFMVPCVWTCSSDITHSTWTRRLTCSSPTMPVTGPGLRSCLQRDSCWPPGQPRGLRFSDSSGGTGAPRAYGLFSLKLVRIKSLPHSPLCPAEVDKHNWSRSKASPWGKKSWTARSRTWKKWHGHDVFKNPTDCCVNIK